MVFAIVLATFTKSVGHLHKGIRYDFAVNFRDVRWETVVWNIQKFREVSLFDISQLIRAVQVTREGIDILFNSS